jgi:hypothetical protein
VTAERDGLQLKLAEATKASETNLAIVTERTKERDALAAENAVLKSNDYDFNKRVATEVARLGITAKATEAKPEPAQKELTATEKCQAAKGSAA